MFKKNNHKRDSLLGCHDIQHKVIGFVHAARADLGEVANALIYIGIDDTLDRSDATAVHSHNGGEDGGGYTGGDLQCAAGLGTVANHAGEVGYHVLYGKTDFLVFSAHQPGDATRRAGGGYYASAQSGEAAKAFLDVDDGEVAEHKGTDELLFALAVFFGIDDYGHGG